MNAKSSIVRTGAQPRHFTGRRDRAVGVRPSLLACHGLWHRSGGWKSGAGEFQERSAPHKIELSLKGKGASMRQKRALSFSLLGLMLCGRLVAQDFTPESPGELITVTSEAVEYVDPTILMTLMQEARWYEPETEVDHAVADLVLEVAKNERAKILRTEAAFSRHRWTSLIAFVVAHALLVLGLSFGILEFRQAALLRNRGRKAEKLELSVSLEGVAVKSSVNGLLLLLFSFAFYLAFLRYVYPLAAT
jgi:hypothetical protein